MIQTAISPDVRETARQRLQTLGQRVTPARLAVLATLLDSPRALSHHDVEVRIGAKSEHFDRVTLYRVLEWLVAQGLAHKSLPKIAPGDSAQFSMGTMSIHTFTV